jgi:hypothetical protein
MSARNTSWEAELHAAVWDWFYHHRMPFLFQLLYPPVTAYEPFVHFVPETHPDFYWAPAVWSLPPSLDMIGKEDMFDSDYKSGEFLSD